VLHEGVQMPRVWFVVLTLILLTGIGQQSSFALIGCVDKDTDLAVSTGCDNSQCDNSCSKSLSARHVHRDSTENGRILDLIGLTRKAGVTDPKKITAWSKELFSLAFGMPVGWDRIAAEKNALVPLSRIDPQLAINLFSKVEVPQADPDGEFPEDVRADAAIEIFSNYWRFAGSTGLPRIESLARHIGDTGEYPYRAMGRILKELVKLPATEGALRGNKIFSEAITYYVRGSKFLNRDEEFLEFLQNAKSAISRAEYQQALRTFVRRLTTEAPTDENYIAEIGTTGRTFRFADENKTLLFRTLPLIAETNFVWAQELMGQYPELKHARDRIVYMAGGVVRGNPNRRQLSALRNEVLQLSLLRNVQKLQLTDFRAAKQLTQRLKNHNEFPVTFCPALLLTKPASPNPSQVALMEQTPQ
jgi:hypothetical protein